MSQAIFKRWGVPALLTAIIGAFAPAAEVKLDAPAAAVALREVELRGKVVCLAEEIHRLHGIEIPAKHEHLYGFRSAAGKYYTLLRTKYSEALFADEQVRAKELVLQGRVFPDTQIFEPVTLRSVRNGALYDLVYYCGVCEIYAVAPGICECCQGPTELIEKPVVKK